MFGGCQLTNVKVVVDVESIQSAFKSLQFAVNNRGDRQLDQHNSEWKTKVFRHYGTPVNQIWF
jgi:hypothetical protein